MLISQQYLEDLGHHVKFFPSHVIQCGHKNKAQEEIDKNIGSARLITLDDRPLLPYVSAVIEEVMRWHVPVPMSWLYFPL